MVNTYSQSGTEFKGGEFLNSGRTLKDWRKKKNPRRKEFPWEKAQRWYHDTHESSRVESHTHSRIHLVEKQKLTQHCKTIILQWKREEKVGTENTVGKVEFKSVLWNHLDGLTRRRAWTTENNHGLEPDLPYSLWSRTSRSWTSRQVTFFNGVSSFYVSYTESPLLWWPRSIMGPGKQTAASPCV